jgi:hypothetical protein
MPEAPGTSQDDNIYQKILEDPNVCQPVSSYVQKCKLVSYSDGNMHGRKYIESMIEHAEACNPLGCFLNTKKRLEQIDENGDPEAYKDERMILEAKHQHSIVLRKGVQTEIEEVFEQKAEKIEEVFEQKANKEEQQKIILKNMSQNDSLSM